MRFGFGGYGPCLDDRYREAVWRGVSLPGRLGVDGSGRPSGRGLMNRALLYRSDDQPKKLMKIS